MLEGEPFQTIYLPELQVNVNPDLILEGEGNKIFVKGKILIPEALLRDSGSKTGVRASDDVIIVDAPKKDKKSLKTDVDIQTTVTMGNRVRIKVGGLDGGLEGTVHLTGRLPERLLGKGTLRIVNGKYNSYGIKLDVTRGNIIFDGRPVDQASLDIMAIRTFNPGKIDEIKAGVTVTGTPLSPLIKLYSDPSMTDTDTLSYMVLGRPTTSGAESKQTALLLKSASTVLGISKSGGIQDQIQQLLGIDTLEVEDAPTSSFTSSRTVATSNGTLDNSLMTVGKYLAPDLYISYGRSLFGDQYLVSARYGLAKRLELESKTGIETSVDLFYKIEFD
jgi:translocation and assembly module TamB